MSRVDKSGHVTGKTKIGMSGFSASILLAYVETLQYLAPIPVYLMHPTIHNLFTSPHIPLIDVQDIKNHQHQMNFAMETYHIRKVDKICHRILRAPRPFTYIYL